MKFPPWVKSKSDREYWRKPWTLPLHPKKAAAFKHRLWEHGLLSPNFTREEAASHDGVEIPGELREQAQRQAFHMERVRHLEGDKPLAVLSWYRSPAHNAAEGGVPDSQHLKARACDPKTPIRAATAEKVFKHGAIGYESPTDNTVRHVDSRPERVRYFYS